MDMKKSWEKCTLAVIFGIVTILYFIALVDVGFTFELTGPIMIATLIFLLGAAIYFKMECFKPEYTKWVLLSVGVINTILIVIAFFNMTDFFSAMSLNNFTLIFFVPLAIYALLPLFLGIKKVLDREAV